VSGLTEVLAGVRPAGDRSEPTAWVAPRVNLLPPSTISRRAVRRAKRGGALGVAAALLVVAGSWAVGAAQASTAQDEVDTALARTSALQAQQAQYAAAPQTLRALRATEDARATAMAQDVSWAAFVGTLSAALPAGAWLDGVQATLTTDDASTAPAVDATAGASGAAADEGSITITARSTSYEDVAAYLDALATVPGVADAYLMTATMDSAQAVPVVSFTITAQVTDAALTHRFAQTADTQEVG
jgi:Tfp pilus assembly protein PilN